MVIIPFSASAIIELMKNNPMVSGFVIDLFSLALPVIGFVYVAIVIVVFAHSEGKNKDE
jgi:hypothetical protein